MITGRRQWRSGSRGQGLVEFSLIFPLFVLLLFAVFDMGRAVFAYSSLTNAAREGARLAIVNQDVTTIDQRLKNQATGVGPQTCIYFLEPGATYSTCDQGSSPPDAVDQCVTVGCVAHVEAWTDFAPITPIIGNLIGSFILAATSQVPIEFVCPNPSIPAWSTADLCPKQP